MGIVEGILVIPSIGTCYPDTCSQGDIKTLLQNVFEKLFPILTPTLYYCATDTKPDFDAADISVM